MRQPDIFIRIRPGKKEKVIRKLKAADISFVEINEQCLSFPGQVKLDKVLILDKEAVIQDLSSQRTGNVLKSKVESGKWKVSWKVWDCCAGSGGKSIMVHDIFPGIDLTVSDIRLSILKNLEKRFSLAGIDKYTRIVADVSSNTFDFPLSTFDSIIADLPCTGSGTWGRTPEQLYFFDAASIERYSRLQKKILKNIIPYLKPTGKLLYITCSVFVPENEEIVNYLKTDCGLNVEKSGIIKGYDQNADTMFAALFTPS